nr:transketolase [Gammaproteobacteria bacterium]
HTKVIYVGSLAGVVPGGPGHSHQSVRDLAALGGIPGLELIEPCNEREAEAAVRYAVGEAKGSCYLRLVSIPVDTPFELPADYRLVPGRGTVLRPGRDAVLIGYGPVLLAEAVRAAEQLSRERGIEVTVVNLPWLNRFDGEWLSALVAGVPVVITLDNHYLDGGQGERLAALLAEHAVPARVVRIGLTDVPVCGTNVEVLHALGLDAQSLAGRIEAALG